MKKFEYKCICILGFGETTGRVLRSMDDKDGSLYAFGDLALLKKTTGLKGLTYAENTNNRF